MALLEQATKGTADVQQKVCVVGLGYIGLPTSSLLATSGYRVHGVDVNEYAVETISRGAVHIYEPDLEVLVKTAVQSGMLSAHLTPTAADVFVLAVPTPFKDDHAPDISYVEAASRSVAPFLRPGNLVVLESTSPVGTTEKVAEWLKELRPDLKFPEWRSDTAIPGQVNIAYCPERVLPGRILKELVDNDRIVGGIDIHSAGVAKMFYERFVKGRVMTTDSRTAEMAKLTENSFRDVNIAFANELSLICDRLDISVWELIDLANHHPRVQILQPGPGVGGHCIAVDPWFIVHAAPEQARLIRTAREVNDGKPQYVVERVSERAARFHNPVIACLGLAFKADIDDLRESPSVEIVHRLAEARTGRILAVEPHITEPPMQLATLDNVTLVDVDTALQESDIVVLLVNHNAFAQIDRQRLAEKCVIDTRGVWR